MRKTILAVLVTLVTLCAFATAQETAEDWVKMGDELYENGYYAEALVAYDQALQIDSNCSDAWFGISGTLYRQKSQFGGDDNDEVLKAIDNALLLDPKNPDYWEAKGKILSNSGRYNESLEAYDSAILYWSDNQADKVSWIWELKAETLQWAGRYEESLQAYDQAARTNSKKEEAARILYSKGNMLKDVGKYDESLEAYDQSFQMYPNAYALVGIGDSLTAIGMYNEAIESYENAIQMDPENIDALVSKGDVLDFLGEHEAVLKEYENALIVHDNVTSFITVTDGITGYSSNYWIEKGQILVKMQNYEDALDAYDMAIETANINYPLEATRGWTVKGNLLNMMGQYGEALEAFNEAIELIPLYEDALNGKSKSIAALSSDSTAEVAFVKAK